MKPSLRQLQYLVAIAETERFGEAARQLNVSQSALSAQIAGMEADLGVSLMERGRHGAVLTPIGRDVLARARIVLREVEELRAVARQSGEKLSGRIQLGVLPSIGPYLLPVAARELHQRYPELRLVVREERTSDLKEGLRGGRFDTVILSEDESAEHVFRPLFTEHIWVCAAPEDPLSQSSDALKIGDLKGRQLLSLGQGHRFSDFVRRIAAEAGAEVSTEYEGTSLDAVRQMAVMGAGVALLPSLYAHSEARRDPELVIRRLDYPSAMRQIVMGWRGTSPLKAEFALLAEAFGQTAKHLLARDGA